MSTSIKDDNHEIEIETAIKENDNEKNFFICIITVILIITKGDTVNPFLLSTDVPACKFMHLYVHACRQYYQTM